MARAVERRAHRVRRGPVAAAHPRRARRVHPRASAPRSWSATTRSRELWPRESGVLYSIAAVLGADRPRARSSRTPRSPTRSRSRRSAQPTGGGEFGLLVREPVGVVGAIIPWNAPVALIRHKIGPALLAGCTVVLKSSPEAPGEGYVFAEAAEQIGLPPGVLNVRDRRPRGVASCSSPTRASTRSRSPVRPRPAARIASLCGERIARVHARARRQVGRGRSSTTSTSRTAATTLAGAECAHDRPGVLVAHPHRRHAEAPRRDGRGARRELRPGARRRPVRRDSRSIGPARRRERQRDRVEGYIAKGVDEGATLADRRRPPEGSRPRLVRRADGVRQRRQLVDDRPGGDLRPGARA